MVSHTIATTDTELLDRDRHQPGETLDDAATESACRVLASLAERERRVLAEIDAAAQRLATGIYGACEACGRRVPPERLRAVPTTRFCIECERVAELH